ncbi:hypothetical protein V1517DRAFT_327760 [Lipomyces orientalis]|uniref:Uncharacterized protein n=1 Tax=Lipomyces orientalis TaxID=1233043 RepID=A0ACC3TIR2_9ASCO
MGGSKEEMSIGPGPDPSTVDNTVPSDSAPSAPAIAEKTEDIEQNKRPKDKSAQQDSNTKDAEAPTSRKRSLESSPAPEDAGDAVIPADNNTLKRQRTRESPVNAISDSGKTESVDDKAAAESSTSDSGVTAKGAEATEVNDAGSAEPTDTSGQPTESTAATSTAGASITTEPQKASAEDTKKENAKSESTVQHGTTNDNKQAGPSIFGSGVSKSASLFGNTPPSGTSPFAFTGKSIFGSNSAFSSGSSDKPKPFSAFSSNNPFLNAFSKDKSNGNDVEENGHAEDENENDAADNFDQPYVQLNLEKKIVETGEEMETSVFNCRAKLYSLDPTEADEGWKERGIGILHLNVLKDDTEAATGTPEPTSADVSKESTPTTRARKSKARIVMRADGVLKVILNLPLVKGIEVMKGMKSSLVSEKFVRIAAWENHKPIQYALRMGNGTVAAEFYDTAVSLINSQSAAQ